MRSKRNNDINIQTEYYDYIIIGGGLAGSTLGFLLKKNNNKVLIIENKINCQKLCGGIISEKTYDLINKIFGRPIIKELDLIKYENCYVKNNKNILKLKSNLYVCEREKLNSIIRNQYLLMDGKLILGETYKSINFEKNIIELNDGKLIKYKKIVGADGVNSKLRFSLLQKQQKKNFALEVNTKENITNKLELQFFSNFNGYAWIIPNSINTILGMGNVNGNTNINDEFIKFINENDCYSDKIKGAFLPSGNDLFFTKGNVFFIGDAAGLIDPITGEGIYYAIYSAYMLSVNCIKYKKNMVKIKNKIKKRLILKKFIYNTSLRNYLFCKYNKNFFIKKNIEKFLRELLA